jgi:hypothetical protein
MSLIRAEWRKATGNLLLTGFLVWIVPIGLLAFYTIGWIVSLAADDPTGVGITSVSTGNWITDMTGVWSLVVTFPANVFGRLLPLAFMAVLFAGEYQWGTLRFVVPRSRRSSLILTKIGVTTFVVTLSYVLGSLIVGVGQSVAHSMVDLNYGPPLTVDNLFRFAGTYLAQLLLGVLSLLILAGFGAIASILTRSILGGVLAGFGLAVLEPMSQLLLVIAGSVLKRMEIVNLYRFAATYHLDNARSWFVNGQPLPPPIPGFTAEPTLMISLIALVLWVGALVGISIILFNRQDITS